VFIVVTYLIINSAHKLLDTPSDHTKNQHQCLWEHESWSPWRLHDILHTNNVHNTLATRHAPTRYKNKTNWSKHVPACCNIFNLSCSKFTQHNSIYPNQI